MMPKRYLLTRGTSWGRDFKGLRDWRLLEMAEQPHLCTCKTRAQMSACLTVYEASRVAFRLVPGGEIYCWDEPNWIPGNTAGHKAVRIVASVDGRGVWGVAR